MKLRIPAIYPITDVHLSGLSHYEQVKRLAAGGAKIVQIREKTAPPVSWAADASKAARFARENGIILIVNDRADMAAAVGAAGVHLGQDDLPPVAVRRVIGDGAIVGYSTHDLEQVRAAIDLPVDYIAFGPIFATHTKRDTEPVVGLERLSAAKKLCGDIPLVAIGGINAGNIIAVLVAGADSAAMIGALVSAPTDISHRMSEMTRLVDGHC